MFYTCIAYLLSILIVYILQLYQVKVVAGKTKGVVTVEWDCSPVGDVIADSLVALIMHAQSSAASIRLTGRPCSHRQKKAREENTEDADKTTAEEHLRTCLLYTSPSPRDRQKSRMPSSA